MLKNYKTFAAGFMAAVILFTGTVAAAASVDTEVRAMLMGSIKMKLYGKDFNPQETDGTYVKPISYNGRTYLPVRYLAEGLGVPVEWDGKTKTLWIGGRIEKVPVNDSNLYQDYYGTILTTDADRLATPDATYQWGICNSKLLELSYYGCFLKPSGNYKHFTASIFLDGQVKQDLIMEFRKDSENGEVLRSLTLKPGQTTDIDLDIGGVQKLCILSNIQMGHDKVAKLVIGEPAFSNNSEQPSKMIDRQIGNE